MEPTPAQKKEILELYENMWAAYLRGDTNTFTDFFDEQITIVGSAESEFLLDKKEATDFYTKVAQEVVGTVELRNRNIRLKSLGETMLVIETSNAYIKHDNIWSLYAPLRITMLVKKHNGKWKFVLQHASIPDGKAEAGQTLGIESITRENTELRDAIKRRTADLELKNRELTIEAALERIRARTMAMHKSDELQDVAVVLFQQLRNFGGDLWGSGIGLCTPDSSEDSFWFVNEKGILPPVSIPHTDDPTHRKLYQGWQNQEALVTDTKDGTALSNHYQYMLSLPTVKGFFQRILDAGLSFPTWQRWHAANFSNGYLLLITTSPYAHEELLVRFANVFDQAYTRFLDLKRAEEQTREARIENALEKIRTRTMAMQHSDELTETSFLLDQEVRALGIQTWGCAFNIYRENDSIEWFGNEAGILPTYTVPREGVFKDYYDRGQKGETLYIKEFKGQECIDHYEYMSTLPVIGEVLLNLKETNGAFPEYQIDHVVYFKYGYLLFITIEHVPEAHHLFKRFANVFEQTYTRFLDLQKSEEQARESQIQLALERVRARTMAMHQSEELSETAAVVFQQMMELGISTERINICLIDEDTHTFQVWATDQQGSRINHQFIVSLDEPTTGQKIYKAWKEGKKSLVVDLSGSELKDWIRYVREELRMEIKQDALKDQRVHSIAFFTHGMILTTTYHPLPEVSMNVLRRFADVFNLTYTRFLDLQKAETQTKKANIEVALERVRARALAMQQPEELIEVAEVLRHEMGLLGIEALETSSIFINDPDSNISECWYAIKDVRKNDTNLVSDHFKLDYNDTWVGREMNAFYASEHLQTDIVMQGQNRIEWIQYCEKMSTPLHGYYGNDIPDRTYHLYKFTHGAIGAASPGQISEESWGLLKRAASVFSLAYSRFKDLSQARLDLQKLKTEKQRAEDALSDLKAAQSQLIQSEKMASLGELTAGIAHEIQNPLNFVNNFSEVSAEMLEEMKEELSAGNQEDAIELVDDIRQNIEKVLHHGKRADGIVKGMLQHSRTGSGASEPTDINALCEEYLRLAYHGFRAKDKSFNAAMETDFDPSIGNINLVQQDIGRVILNLITNAFWAVNEKSKTSEDGYQPTVSVTTKKQGDQIIVSIADNGSGIPDEIKDKVFQPFFTTKPTGQGTGLGLSLSYDIIKAHDGEIHVKSMPHDGTRFSISLPAT